MTEHPITRLRAESFGAFASVDVTFAAGINVFIGENGAGKSQLIKLLYGITKVLNSPDQLAGESPRRTSLSTTIAAKLMGVFRPDTLGRLTNRRRGRTTASLEIVYGGLSDPLAFDFSSMARTEVKVARTPDRWVEDTPVFFPTRELLSIAPGFTALYNSRQVEFDETWRDTVDLLSLPSLRGPWGESVSQIMRPIAEALNGTVVEENGRFYLQQPGIGKLEMHLVAEGLRKLAMLARLVSSGTLLRSGYLFWDEPETNLNPKTLKDVAMTIVALGDAGVQVFIATHSLFLLREIEIILASRVGAAPSIRFIGLHRGEAGVTLSDGESLTDIGDITALDEELQQSDRYFEIVP